MASIAEDFIAYVNTNWNSASITEPVYHVFNFNRERLIQGFTSEAIIVHRGSIHFVPLDHGYQTQGWETSVLISSTDTARVQILINEFMRIINAWEVAGNISFATGGFQVSTLENSVWDISSEKNAIGSISFFSRQRARNT